MISDNDHLDIGIETIEYAVLRNKYGVRKPGELFSPRLVPMMGFPGLPFNSVMHYIGEGIGDLGPTHESIFLRRYKIPAMVDHVLEHSASKGNPRKVPANLVSLTRQYHRQNFRMRPMRKWSSVVGDRRTPIIVNYAVAPYGYRYINNFMVNYNRWYNTMHTVWSKIEELAKQYDRQHFILFQLPDVMPSIGDLKRAELMVDQDNVPASKDGTGIESFTWFEDDNGDVQFSGYFGLESFKQELIPEVGLEQFEEFDQTKNTKIENIITQHIDNTDQYEGLGLEALNRTMLEIFSSPELLNLMDLWIWMGDTREKSLMSLMSKSTLNKVNFVFVEGGKVSVLNLGLLDSIRSRTEVLGRNQLHPKQAQRLMIRFIDKLLTARSQKSDIDSFIDESDDEEIEEYTDEQLEFVNEFLGEDTTVSEDSDDITDEMIAELDEEDSEPLPSQVERREEELASLVVESLSRETVSKLTTNAKTPEELVKEEINSLADVGAISAQDYRKLDKIATTYRDLPNPFGEGTLGEFIDIPEELKVLPKDNKLPINPVGLPDKSMLGNTLQVMQKTYITKVFNRHTTSCIVNALQRQGVTIQKYQVEKTRTLLDEYDTHIVSVVPTRGAPSTVRLKIPHVRVDGTYISNGIVNRLNPQRTDVPIRKINSREVMLSSYYGKLMVRKAERATFNADKWILNTIAKRGMDPDDETITDLRVLKSFRFDQKLPSIYSLLSTRFSGFVAGDKTFFTNYDKLRVNFTEEELTAYYNESQIPIAKDQEGHVIVIDYDNVFYRAKGQDLEPLGTLEDVIGLDIEKRPIDILELDIFTVLFPLGLVLGYYVGLNELLKLLKPNYRRVERIGRTKLDVAPNEFAVVFNDQYIVFEKGNKLVEYIFGGFNRWPRDLQRYNAHLFNKPDVYAALFERNGITARYIRELKQIFTMFLDPITIDNLKLINEPTEMFQLFVRAAEMLTSMDYKAASDATESRDRGYERIAGLAYAELSRSMRTFKSKTSPNARFEINPLSVWMGTIQDASNALVEDSNPIHNMKEREVVVFGGTGGRGQRSLQGNHRAYHPTQLGTTSEATKDSGKVATIVYTSQDPKYNSIYGTTDRYNPEEDGASRLLSGSVLLAPASDHED